MDKLTKAEEEIMQLFWEHGPSTVSQLIEKMEEPKPPHSTISTFVRILEKKGFVDHKAYGRTYEYFPLIDKATYSKFSLKKLVGNYFDGSLNALVSFLVKEDDLSLKDLSQLINELKDEEQ
jgi:predicted transcriptional regulator